MEYAVKGFLGFFKRLIYHCPACGAELESRLRDAGENDVCPICCVSFVVPGGAEKRRKQAQRQARCEALEAKRKAAKEREVARLLAAEEARREELRARSKIT